MSGQASNSLSISALMSSSSNTPMKIQDNPSYAVLSSNKEMEVLESLLQLQMSKDDKPSSSSLTPTTKRKSFQANEEQQLLLQSIPPITQIETQTTPSDPISKTEHIEDSLPKRLRQFQNSYFDNSLDNGRFTPFSVTQPNPDGTSPVWPMANLSLPLPPKSRPLANYSNVHSKSLNDLQSMVRITKNLQRPPPPSSLIPKKCNSFEEIPGVNAVKAERSFSNIQLPTELPPDSPEPEPKKAASPKTARKPALPFEPTFLVRDKIPPNRRFFDEQWMQHFQELKEFHAKYGHTNVTRTADEYRGLGNWVAEQRRKLRKGRLSKEQFELLNTIDFEWDRSYYFKATTEPNSSQSPPASPPVSRMVVEVPQTPPYAPVESLYPKPLPPLPFQMTEIKKEPKTHRVENLLNTHSAPGSPMDLSYSFSPYPSAQEAEKPAMPQQKTLSVLIAQEDVSNRIILVKLLEGMGYEDIDVAESGLQMAEMAYAKNYDCIVVDLSISGVDAIQFTKHIRSDTNKHQPYIIGVSTKSSAVFLEDRNRCIQAGVNEIVSSPLNRDHLNAALQTCYAFKPL
mmetsp:Transcript_3526/g.4856  ORF Transcript_3526/g.4856 Transcript_3526/m.4856 type:complete len:569 (-) Transcript_3526:87-1793(-)